MKKVSSPQVVTTGEASQSPLPAESQDALGDPPHPQQHRLNTPLPKPRPPSPRRSASGPAALDSGGGTAAQRPRARRLQSALTRLRSPGQLVDILPISGSTISWVRSLQHPA
jgi:hypothetical protein